MLEAEHKRAVCCWVMAWLSLLLALLTMVQAEQLPIKTYTAADGLAHDRINRIVRDSHGFLWFCTYDGLSQFDGSRFTSFSVRDGLAFSRVSDLLESRDGSYWVATMGGGVCRFDPNAHARPGAAAREAAGVPPAGKSEGRISARFTTYPVGHELATNLVVVLYEDRAGHIWAGTQGGLFRLDVDDSGRRAFRRVRLGIRSQPEDVIEVVALLEDGEGSLWMGTNVGLLRRLPDGRVIHYPIQPSQTTDYVWALLIDGQERLWLGHQAGVVVLKPQPITAQHQKPEAELQQAKGDISTSEMGKLPSSRRPAGGRLPEALGQAMWFTAANGLTLRNVHALRQSSDGRIWIGSYEGGLAVFDGQRFRPYTTAHGLSRRVNTLAEDRDGNLWVGTQASGALKIAHSGFVSYDEADGLGDPDVISIFENQSGELCVISAHWWISRFEGDRFTAVRPNLPPDIGTGSAATRWVIIQDHKGEWWVATGRGLYRFPRVNRLEELARVPPKAVYTTRDGLADSFISRLFEDSGGDIWISSFHPPEMLTRWERSTGRFHRYWAAHGLPPFNWANAFCQDASGHLWLGLHNGGLARYRRGRFEVFSKKDGVPEGMIKAQGLYCDRGGRLWIASGAAGAAHLDDPTAADPQFETYSITENLSSNNVSCFTEDAWGRIYIGTARGVDRLDLESGRIRWYTTADGLIKSEVTTAFCDHQGRLWFGTREGVSRLTPEPDQPRSGLPIRIRGLRLAGVPYLLSELGETVVSGLELGANQNQIQIDFFGLSFGMGEKLRYQYKLEGADREWSLPTDEHSVNYANLSPGDYRFLVRAVTSGGVASPRPAAVAFTILRPIWQRWWLFTLAALMVGLVVYAAHRYRLARLLELERVRTRITTDLHDDIGSSLSQIAILSEVVRQQVGGDHPQVTEPLSRIASVSRELVDAMSDIVWAVNPQRDRLRDLTQRMRRFVSDTFTARNIDFRFQGPGEEYDMKLGADVRRQVFLIFKESVNNIARHSDCTEAEVRFQIERGWLLLRLSDNGRGFDLAQSADGHGLRSMHQRAKDLGGRLEVVSRPGRGTTVTLRAPMR